MKPTTKPLSKLTAAEKRVAIAKDVLAQIKRKKFIVKSGRYWEIKSRRFLPYELAKNNLREKLTTCRVCAAGAAIVSGIRLYNKHLIARRCRTPSEVFAANDWFSTKQLALIEAAFELPHQRVMGERLTAAGLERAIRFTRHTRSFVERAVLIYTNIVRNKGEFKP